MRFAAITRTRKQLRGASQYGGAAYRVKAGIVAIELGGSGDAQGRCDLGRRIGSGGTGPREGIDPVDDFHRDPG